MSILYICPYKDKCATAKGCDHIYEHHQKHHCATEKCGNVIREKIYCVPVVRDWDS